MWRRVGAGGSGASLGRNTTGRGSRYPELDCVRGHVAPEVLTAAEDRAARVGIGADRALIAAGASSAVLGWIGLSRRRMTRTAWILLLTPLHWLLLSWAAWRALCQLLVSPYVWEKTEHGLARHWRRMARLTQLSIGLEREFVAAQSRADLIASRRRPERPPRTGE